MSTTGKPASEPLGEELASALLDFGNELARDRAPDHRILELKTRRMRTRSNAQVDLGKLAATTRLLLVAAMAFGPRGHRLAIRNRGRPVIDIDLVATVQPVELHIEVHRAHARHQQFARFLVAVRLKRGVFRREFVDRVADLLLVPTRLGPYVPRVGRARELRFLHLQQRAIRRE